MSERAVAPSAGDGYEVAAIIRRALLDIKSFAISLDEEDTRKTAILSLGILLGRAESTARSTAWRECLAWLSMAQRHLATSDFLAIDAPELLADAKAKATEFALSAFRAGVFTPALMINTVTVLNKSASEWIFDDILDKNRPFITARESLRLGLRLGNIMQILEAEEYDFALEEVQELEIWLADPSHRRNHLLVYELEELQLALTERGDLPAKPTKTKSIARSTKKLSRKRQ